MDDHADQTQYNDEIYKLKLICKNKCYDLIEVKNTEDIPACIIHNLNDKVIIIGSNINATDINELIINYIV